jgi:hypothetical protein
LCVTDKTQAPETLQEGHRRQHRSLPLESAMIAGMEVSAR